MFADDAGRERYEAAVELQRDEMARRGVRYSVGPEPVSVVTPSGKRLASGTPTTVADWHGGTAPAWRLLQGLIDSGHIISADVDDDDGPRAA
ncbi:MAG: hypothetical protein ABI548_25305 [Polyangiaceae bacterium]